VLGDALKIPGVNIDTYVIGQDLYIAAPSVSDDLEHKVAQCLTFAYDATHPKFHNADVETWYDNYFEALQHTGLWIPLGDESWATVNDSDVGVDVHETLVKLVSGLLGGTGDAIKLIGDSLTALKNDTTSPWFTVFDLATRSIKVPSCQITVVTHEENQPVMLYILAFALEVSQLDGQLLFFRFSSHRETLKYRKHVQMIDQGGLDNIDKLAPAIAARIGTLGPSMTA
jgi:hypothetical protein